MKIKDNIKKSKNSPDKVSREIETEEKGHLADAPIQDEQFDPIEADDKMSDSDRFADGYDHINELSDEDIFDNADGGNETDNKASKSEKKSKKRKWRLGRKIGRRIKKNAKSLIRLLIIIVIAAVISVIYINRDDLSLSNITNWINESLMQGNADEFPVNISGGHVEAMDSMKNNIAVISDTSLMVIKENGKFAVNRQHNLSNPSMICSQKTVMTYEIGSNAICINDRHANQFELEAEDKILAADMNEDGYYAYATRSSDGFMSEFHVYNDDNQNIFRSRQTKYLITDLSISDDSKTIAVLMIGVESGEYVSVIKLFDLKSDTPIEINMKDILVLGINNTEDGILALSQDSVYKLDNFGEQIDRFDFDDQLSEFNFADNSEILLIFERTQINGDNTVIILDENCQILIEIAVKEEITALDRYDDQVYILTPNTLYCYDKNGEYKNEWIMQGNAKSLTVNDGYAYVCDNGMIYSINVK